tara:strand:- start:931 stop:1350 length:420 start_codon:yes stop_codon:yes gene_type:complete
MIIIDSNVLFSALIKNSFTRRIILEYEGYFLFPEYILEEFEKHKDELFRKSDSEREELELLLILILKKCIIIPDEVLSKFCKKAEILVKDIDLGDTVFVACALAYPGSVIWSDDKALKGVKGVRVLNSSEIALLLSKHI